MLGCLVAKCCGKLRGCDAEHVAGDGSLSSRAAKLLLVRIIRDRISVLIHIVHCRLKGPTYEQGTRLQAASGLHHLIGNHWAVLVRILAYTLIY